MGFNPAVAFRHVFIAMVTCNTGIVSLVHGQVPGAIKLSATAVETRSNTLEARIDLPSMNRQEIRVVDLKLTNGDEAKPLSLKNASVGCGCIDVIPMQELIPPGESGMIRLSLKPLTSSGVNWVQTVSFSLPDASVPNVRLTLQSHIHSILKSDISQVVLSFKPASQPKDVASQTFNIEHSAPVTHENLQIKGETEITNLNFDLKKVSDTQSTLTISAFAGQLSFADTNLDFAIVDAVTKQAIPITCLVRFQKTLEVLPARHVATLQHEDGKAFYQFNALISRYYRQEEAQTDPNALPSLLVNAKIGGLTLPATVASQNWKIARIVVKVAQEELDETIAEALLSDPSFVPKINWDVIWDKERVSSRSVLTIVNP